MSFLFSYVSALQRRKCSKKAEESAYNQSIPLL